ncbi:MAG: peroxiredoxin family protein [Thermomicrobiales bacterium]
MKSATVPIGSPAPAFTLIATDGNPRDLGQFAGAKLVLIFYRGHWCGACRGHLEQVRDLHQSLCDVGAAVLAISSETFDEARAGTEKHAIPFIVLSDPDLAVIDRYGVRDPDESEGRPISRPAIFIIDHTGIVRFAHVGEHPRDRHSLDLVLLALETI